MRATAILLCALLAGCYVDEFQTSDGTRCVKSWGVYTSSVDCDWSRQEIDQLRQQLADRIALDALLYQAGDRAFCDALAKRERQGVESK